MQTRNPSPAQTDARRENSRQSTGPRTCRGKRHSRRNALKHGLYSDVQYFYWEAARELGEDPGQFWRLYAGLLEARCPADALEQVLLEDIAVLIWKKARLERSEAAVQVCNVRKHDLERRKQFMQVGHDGTTMSQAEMLEKGLRVTLDAPGKFEKVLEMLGMLEDLTERNEFSDDMHRLLLALYGQQPTLRGAGLLNGFVKLRKLQSEGQDLGDVKRVFEMTQAQETEEVLGEYELFLHEHVENTRAARIAAMAPSHAQWAAIIRQQNALHRQMERKIRLLDEMQERRRRRGSATDLLSRLAGQFDPSGDAGGRPAPTTPNPSGAPCAVVGACHGVSVPTPATDDAAGEVREPPLPESEASRFEPAPSPQSVQPRAADMPNGSPSAPPPGGEDLSADEKTQNRGNEAKKSLKTNEVGKTICAKPTHSCARNASKEAKERGFRCNVRRWVGRIQPRVGVAKARAPDFMGRGESMDDRLCRRRTS